MTTDKEPADADAIQPKADLRWLAWSGAALGTAMIFLGWLMTPAEGSNYAVVLADQADRIEAGMWVSAAIGVGVPVMTAVEGTATAKAPVGLRSKSSSASLSL